MRQKLPILFAAIAIGLFGCSGNPMQPASAHTRAVAAPSPETRIATRQPESAAALVGKRIFLDTSLSASGRQSCASCHSPDHAYAPANAMAAQLGGPQVHSPGLRAVPSLRYTLARTPIWAFPRPTSRAEQLTEKDLRPQGGLDWDGRFNTLHQQAASPLTQPNEMASNQAAIVHAIASGSYASEFRAAFGTHIFEDPAKAFAAALQAIERFELEDVSFHPYSSKYDQYLDGKAQLTAQERHGLLLFNDPTRGNCASCHISQKGADGSHPLFTDFQFQALGVPRDPEIAANRNPRFYDMGLCGPQRSDQTEKQYCGMFKTPTLRNVASRHAFFHNGRFHTLREAVEFYAERDTNPDKWYPHGEKFNDLPPQLRKNIDVVTLPMDRKKGEPPVWNSAEIDDVVAFLKTLNDADQTAQ